MKHGYVIIVKDYKAEICEFETLTVINMPDGSKLYFIHTKYGDNYFYEGDLKVNRSDLEQMCEELNKALNRALRGVHDKTGSNKTRRQG